MSDKQELFDAKIARLRAAVSLEPHDRVPVAALSELWPVRLSQKYTMQEAFYNIDVAAECYSKAFSRWDMWDAFHPGMQSIGPFLDATGSSRLKVPGKDLPPQADFQHPDATLMSAEEYSEIIENPLKFHVEKIIPRLCSRLGSESVYERTVAWVKAAVFLVQFIAKGRSYETLWKNEYGVPPLFQGLVVYVPADLIADKLRGFQQTMLDVKQRTQELQAACEALLPLIVDASLAMVPVASDFPLVMNPQHLSPFLSPKDYQKVYWPTFKKLVDAITGRGFKMWVVFESNQEHHLECLQELPKGEVVAHLESTDLAKAKKALGGRLCIAGGMPPMLLTRGTPQEVKEQTRSVLKLFEDEPGFIMTCGSSLPSGTKPENVDAWLEALGEYGSPCGGTGASAAGHAQLSRPALPTPMASDRRFVTPWESVRPEFGEILGDEGVIKANWDYLEKLALAVLFYIK